MTKVEIEAQVDRTAMDPVGRLLWLKSETPSYEGDDPRAAHYRCIREALNAGIAALTELAALRTPCAPPAPVGDDAGLLEATAGCELTSILRHSFDFTRPELLDAMRRAAATIARLSAEQQAQDAFAAGKAAGIAEAAAEINVIGSQIVGSGDWDETQRIAFQEAERVIRNIGGSTDADHDAKGEG